MTIKSNGGVFGRNPTFNTVTIDGILTARQNIVMADGKGIDFSATAGTGTSELFDDYEEGYFTPFLFSDTGGEWAGKITDSGRYIKVGSVVQVEGNITWSSKASGASGTVRFRGLPFNAAASAVAAPYIRWNSTEAFDAIRLQNTITDSHFRVSGAAAQASSFGASGSIYFNFSYQV